MDKNAGPWNDYQSASPAAGPWDEFKSAQPEKPRTRGLVEALNDNVIEFANAAAGGVASAANFVSPGNKLSSFIDENIIKSGEQKQSDVVRAEKQRLSSGLDSATGITDELGAVGSYVINNPLLAASQAAGSFAVPGGVVKGGGKVAQALGAGAKGIETAGRAGGIAAGAAMAGGDAAGTAYDLSKKAGATEDQAIAAGRQASVIPAAVGGLTGAFGAEKLLAGGKGFTGNALTRGLKSGLSEAGQEGLEEGVTQYEGQRAAMPYDATIDPTKGVAGAAGLGAIMGGATGAAASLLTPSQKMGIDPNAGPLSRAAAGAVDSGVSQQIQAEQIASQIAQNEEKVDGVKKNASEPPVSEQNNIVQDEIAPVPTTQEAVAPIADTVVPQGNEQAVQPDAVEQPVTQPVEPVAMEQRSLDELRQAFRNAQDPTIRKTIAAEIRKRREAMQDPLQPSLIDQQTGEISLEPTPVEIVAPAETQQASPQEPQAEPAGTEGLNGEPTDVLRGASNPSSGTGPDIADAGMANNVGNPDGATGAAAPVVSEQSQPSIGKQPAADQVALTRPDNWRSNAIKAGKVARSLGLDPKGKRLKEIVAEIDAKDGAPVAVSPEPKQEPATQEEKKAPTSKEERQKAIDAETMESRKPVQVAQPTPMKRVSFETMTLSGPKKVNAKLYELPRYDGPQLAVAEYKTSRGLGYKVYLPKSGAFIHDSNGVSTLEDTLQLAVLRIKNARETIAKRQPANVKNTPQAANDGQAKAEVDAKSRAYSLKSLADALPDDVISATFGDGGYIYHSKLRPFENAQKTMLGQDVEVISERVIRTKQPIKSEKLVELELVPVSPDARMDAAKDIASDGFFAATSKTGQITLITPSAKNAGKFQRTIYDSKGPVSDAQHDSIEDAIVSAADAGYSKQIDADRAEKLIQGVISNTDVKNAPIKPNETKAKAAPVEASKADRGDAATNGSVPAKTGAGDVQADGVKETSPEPSKDAGSVSQAEKSQPKDSKPAEDDAFMGVEDRGTTRPMPEDKAPGPQGDAQQGADKGNAVTANAKTSQPWAGDVYHGTAGPDFDGFNPRTARSVWFAADPRYAKKYADSRQAENKRVLVSSISLKNPLVIDMKGMENPDTKKMPGAMRYASTIEDIAGIAQQWGHDGVIFKNRKATDEGYLSDEIAVFDTRLIGYTRTATREGDSGKEKAGDSRKNTAAEQSKDLGKSGGEVEKSAPVSGGASDGAFMGAKSKRTNATPTDRAVMAMASEGKSANDILQFIANASKSPFNRQIAQKLIATKANPAVSVGADMGSKDGYKNLALYSRKNHEIQLAPEAEYKAEQIFLHEAIHSATLLALDKKTLFGAQMNRLYESVKAQGLSGEYGMKNVGEFVAEAMSNKEFQKKLKGYKAPNEQTSLWDKFVAIVRKILGMEPAQQDALSKALELGVEVMRENMPLRAAKSFRAEDGPAYAGVDQTETEAFKKWFGGSKVVEVSEKRRGATVAESQALGRSADSEGAVTRTTSATPPKPKVVYHGTKEQRAFVDSDGDLRVGKFSIDFNEFSRKDKANDGGFLGQGFYFADAEVANSYAVFIGADTGSTALYPVYLSIKNPLEIFIASEADYRLSAKDVEGYDGVIATHANGDMEYVAFRPEQIKSAIGNNGNFDPNDPDIANFGIADAVEQIKAFDVKTAPKNTWAHYRGMAMQALGRRQIVDLYEEELPQLGTYNDLVQQMDAEKNENGAQADKVAQDWGSLKNGMDKKLAELMHDATLAKVDPTKPIPDGYLQRDYDALKARYEALSPEAKKLFTQARDMYKDHYKAVQQAIKDRVERSEMSDSQKKKMMASLDEKLFKELEGVYFPLARFGQYVIVVKGPNGDVKNVTRAETVKEAEAARKELQKAFPAHMGNTVGKVLKQAEFNAGRDAVGKGFMADLMNALDEKGVDDELRDTVAQLYLSSLPDLSWAKHGIHRKGTPGFSQDARRAFAQNMFHGARYLAKLRYSDQLQDELTAMQDYVKAYEGVEEYDSIQGQQVVDEMVKRHEILMNPKSSPVSTALTSFGFLFHMGLSPASAMVNLTQTALVAYPQMGAKWGFDKAGAALLKASDETVRAKNDLASMLKGDELAAFNRATKDGTIDVTMAHDLAGVAQGEDQGVMWKIRPVMRWASFMFHHAEKFNRQATFLAAYRLAKAANPSMNEDSLYEEAKKATYDGHFDYSAANRARVMQGNWQRVILLFKQYAQSMLYTLSRNAYQSIKALDQKERSQARKTLAGILAGHAAAAGVLGLPIVGPLLTIASWIGGDDDEPWDAEVAMQNAMADMLGPKAAEVIARGFSRLTPFDISGRVALNKLILPDVQEGLEGKQWAESAMAAALGPVAGIGVNMARGVQKITEGDYMRGMEDMLPTALRGPLKAVRYNIEGAQDKTGITITDDVSLAGEAGQFLGLSPSQVRRDTERRSAIYGYDKALLERRSVLMRMFAEARISGDNEGAQEIQKEIQGFNQKNPSRRITPQNLAQSIRNRRKRVEEAQQGVYLPSKRRDALDSVTF